MSLEGYSPWVTKSQTGLSDLDTHKPLMRTDTARHLDQGPEHMTHEARLRIPDPRENKHVI